MSQNNSLNSLTTAAIEASTISRRLSILDPRIQRMEPLRRAKVIFVLRYDIIVAVFFSRREFWCQLFQNFWSWWASFTSACKDKRTKFCFLNLLFSVHTFSFWQIHDSCRLPSCLQCNLLPAGWKFKNQIRFCWTPIPKIRWPWYPILHHHHQLSLI